MMEQKNKGELYDELLREAPRPISIMRPTQLSAYPITTTSSVIGMCFDGGVILAGDLAGNYGKMQMFSDFPRIKKIYNNTLLACSGDYADYQYLESIIEGKLIDDERHNDGLQLKPKSIHAWIARVLHNRRNKFDPLWTNFLVAGLQDGKPFLGYADKLGLSIEVPHMATGFAHYLASGLMRDAYEKAGGMLTKDQAIEVVKQGLRVCFYRDCLAYNQYQMGIVTAEGSDVQGPLFLDTDWSVAKYIE